MAKTIGIGVSSRFGNVKATECIEVESLKAAAQTDKSGAATSPYSDIPPGYHVVPSTPATTIR